jgi:hypothetical protein
MEGAYAFGGKKELLGFELTPARYIAVAHLLWVALVCVLPRWATDSTGSSDGVYSFLFIVAVVLIIARAVAEQGHWLFRSFIVLFAAIGSAFVLMGGGEYFAVAYGAQAAGSISDVQALLDHKPTPRRLYLNDGFVAKELSLALCNAGYFAVEGDCYGSSIAPVYTSKASFLAKGEIVAWARSLADGHSTIPDHRCEKQSAPLCGMPLDLDTAEIREKLLTEWFDERVHLEKTGLFTEEGEPDAARISSLRTLPVILFQEPPKFLKPSWGCFITGAGFLAVSLLVVPPPMRSDCPHKKY